MQLEQCGPLANDTSIELETKQCIMQREIF